MGRPGSTTEPDRGRAWRFAGLATTMAVATALRVVDLGRPSLWYDEVVTMRLARQDNPAELVRLMMQIDASRAPLHPILLQGWVTILGPSDLSARAFSAACGVLTVLMTYRIGRRAFDEPTGLWGAWLCALSPALVRYSREVRMYALLVLLTCLAWDLLLSFRRGPSPARAAFFTLCLVALVYTHPLGLFMVAALAVAFVIQRKALRLSWWAWLATQAIAALAAAPWIGRYIDHPPEFLLARPAIRHLLGMPIEFIGGNSIALLSCALLIALGLLTAGAGDRPIRPGAGRWRARIGDIRIDRPAESSILLIWFAVPPVLLFAYSYGSHPIYGPARYTLYVAPAYLLMVARGLKKLPILPRYTTALVFAVLAALMMRTMVFAPDLQADWRAAARYIQQEDPRATICIPPVEPGRDYLRAEPARYYLPPEVVIKTDPDSLVGPGLAPSPSSPEVWVAIRVRDGALEHPIPSPIIRAYRTADVRDFPGLRLFRMVPRGGSGGGEMGGG